MVGSVGSGSSFAGLAGYLEFGRGADESREREEDGRALSAEVRRDGRVAFVETRNQFGVDDPATSAELMEATLLRTHSRVEKGVYHLSVGLHPEDGDPKDPRTHAVLRQVAHQLLERIGLGEHEALIVGHQDTAHPHVHLMVNRVHPETGKTWERWHDYAKIERALRAMEVELGLRVVPGKHAPVPELAREQADIDRLVGDKAAPREPAREPVERPAERAAERVERATDRPANPPSERPDRSADAPGVGRPAGAARPAELDDPERQPGYVPGRTKGEEREFRRTGGTPLVDDARQVANLIRAARSWDEVALYLDAAGLRLERKGQGLVVTDGAREVKASRVDRAASLGQLEARFGETYAAWEGRRDARTAGSRTAEPQGDRRPPVERGSAPPARQSTVPNRAAPDRAGAPATPVRGPGVLATGLVRAARSWDELAVWLESAGLRAERQGRTLVIASAATGRPVARTALADVEGRFGPASGVPARIDVTRSPAQGTREGWAARPALPALSLSGRYLVAAVAEFAEAMRLRAALAGARDQQRVAAAARDSAAAAGMRRADAEAALAQALRAVFRDPIAAERAVQAAARQHGDKAAADLLRRTPEQFGALRGSPDPARSFADRAMDRMTGRAREDAAALAAARRASGDAAVALRAWDDARRALERRAGTVYDERRAPARAAQVDARVAGLEARAAALGPPASIAAEVARVLPRVPVEERARLEAALKPEAVGVLRAFAATVPAYVPSTPPTPGREAGAPSAGAPPRASSVARSYADREAVSAVVQRAIGALGARDLRPELRRAAAAGELPPRLREEIREAWGRIGERPRARDPRERVERELDARDRFGGGRGGRGGLER